MTEPDTSDTAMNPGSQAPRPWYREPWPWVLIAIPALTIIASAITLWLAISRPDPLVLEDEDYRRVQAELRAQDPADGRGDD